MKNKTVKQKNGALENMPLSAEDKATLDNRYNHWKNAPSSAISLEDAKKQLMQKYGK